MTLVSSWLTSPRNSGGHRERGRGASNKRRLEKIRNIQPISRRISETVQDRPCKIGPTCNSGRVIAVKMEVQNAPGLKSEV